MKIEQGYELFRGGGDYCGHQLIIDKYLKVDLTITPILIEQWIMGAEEDDIKAVEGMIERWYKSHGEDSKL